MRRLRGTPSAAIEEGRVRGRLTLAGQFLLLQLAIVVALLIAVAGVSLAQADARFRAEEGRRMLTVAEAAAATDVVRVGLADPDRVGILQPTAENLRSLAGADHLVFADDRGRALTALGAGGSEAAGADAAGAPLDLGESRVLSGKAWIGVTDLDGDRAVVAHAPVIADDGRVLGFALAGRDVPGPAASLAGSAPDLFVYLGVASFLGVVGSLLLARRVKRQTLGMEPGEIAGLARHREAMLQGIREGVLGVDAQGRVVLVNAPAAELLRLPADAAGRGLEELGVEADIAAALTERGQAPDRVVLINGRLVTVNCMPLGPEGADGSVTTLRDHTDLVAMRGELDATRTATEALRAQAHEFSNQLHVIGGLIGLEAYEEAAEYIARVGGARTRLTEDVAARVADPSVAALLIAKASLAAEQDTGLEVAPGTDLPQQDGALSADLVTVVGNLVDNALEAVRGQEGGRVEVELAEAADGVRVRVRDSGPGVPPELAEEVFRRGFSTKGGGGRRGVGLALIRMVCERRGGAVRVEGAEFTAVLPAAGQEEGGRE
ncbi:ATP-binding protein [Nocardiopsis sp. RSe5-2]|uniref:histidine kinase n=1 Tax=Nocardiopsis endophytica TaxID=3018445 RepID=A0ABT4UDZ8_9ACTN|nr:ATP-binding protein [Nocardiopsis endophytica]MDA2815208.1 ATP-binding protein [Nocardiopsis endophytica]